MATIKNMVMEFLLKKGTAKAEEIIKKIVEERNANPSTVRLELLNLDKSGMVEKPEYAHYKLTQSGTAFITKYNEKKQNSEVLSTKSFEEEDMEAKELKKQLLEFKRKFGREKLLSELKEVIAFME